MRTFIAAECDRKDRFKEVQQEILDQIIANKNYIKAVDVNNLHFTLFFLGEISQSQLEEVTEKISQIKFEKITLVYTGIGAFPSLKFPKILWIGIDQEGTKNLVKLFNIINQNMTQIGFRTENNFVPHLTLFRIKTKVQNIEEIYKKFEYMDFGEDTVDRIYLKKSDTRPTGPIYSNLLTVYAVNN